MLMSEVSKTLRKQYPQDYKRILTNLLKEWGMLSEDDVGQIVLHVNSGGVSKVIRSLEVK